MCSAYVRILPMCLSVCCNVPACLSWGVCLSVIGDMRVSARHTAVLCLPCLLQTICVSVHLHYSGFWVHVVLLIAALGIVLIYTPTAGVCVKFGSWKHGRNVSARVTLSHGIHVCAACGVG
jgi:hypothetical protein